MTDQNKTHGVLTEVWAHIHRATGDVELSLTDLPDLPFNREKWESVRFGAAPQSPVAPANPWYDAVLRACMSIEAAYIESDPAKTVAQLIDWHRKDAVEPVAPADERAAFDAWYFDHYRREPDMGQGGAIGRWYAWQARARLAVVPPVSESQRQQIISEFLERTGQYVTNDASRQAAIDHALTATIKAHERELTDLQTLAPITLTKESAIKRLQDINVKIYELLGNAYSSRTHPRTRSRR